MAVVPEVAPVAAVGACSDTAGSAPGVGSGWLPVGFAALAISACAPRYYDRYDRYGYYGPRDHIEYSDRSYYDRFGERLPN